MAYDFPKSREVHLQLLYDRQDFLYGSGAQLIEKITGKAEEPADSLLETVINNRPTSSSTAFELLKHRYNGLRLMTLLGITDPNGIFRTTVPYDSELRKELEASGNWCIRIAEDEMTMEVSTLSF